MKHYSPDFTHLAPGHSTCSFINHLNSPGSIQPSCHFWPTELFKHTSLHYPTRYPLTPGSREFTCRQSALPHQYNHAMRNRQFSCPLSPGESWLSGSVSDLQARDHWFELLARLNLLWHCAPGQGTLPTRALVTL